MAFSPAASSPATVGVWFVVGRFSGRRNARYYELLRKPPTETPETPCIGFTPDSYLVLPSGYGDREFSQDKYKPDSYPGDEHFDLIIEGGASRSAAGAVWGFDFRAATGKLVACYRFPEGP